MQAKRLVAGSCTYLQQIPLERGLIHRRAIGDLRDEYDEDERRPRPPKRRAALWALHS